MKTNLIFRTTLISAMLTAAMASGAAMAQQDVPGHPRVNEVNNRLENQQDRVDKGVANGTINAKQATRDEKHDANIAQRESADEAKHGGHLTKREKRNLNKSLNKDSHRIHKQRHAKK
ncbi:MAG: hypothetical protein ACRETW_01440 [Stenotrophobium sp.]